MPKITAKVTFLDPVEVDPEERVRVAERKAQARGLAAYDVDPDDIDISEVATYALRYEEGKSYNVSKDKAQYFIRQGWADNANRSLKDEDLDEPWDTRQTTDEEAERLEREVHEPARRRDMEEERVTTFTASGRVYRRTGPGPEDIEELQPHQVPVDERGYVLDVQDAITETEGGF